MYSDNYLLLQPHVKTHSLSILSCACPIQSIAQDDASDPYAHGLEELGDSSCMGPDDASSSEVSSVTAGRLERLIGQLKELHVLGEGSRMGSCEVNPEPPKPDGKPVGLSPENPKPVDKSWVTSPVDKSWVTSECKVVDLTGVEGEEAKTPMVTPTLTGSPSQRLAQFFKNKKEAEQRAKEKGIPPSSIFPDASKSREMPKNEYVLPDYVP